MITFYIFITLLLIVGFVTQYVQMYIIVPFVIKHRGKKYWDNIAGTHQYNRLIEYKKICEEKKLNVFWYNFQIVMTCLLVVLAISSLLLVIPYMGEK